MRSAAVPGQVGHHHPDGNQDEADRDAGPKTTLCWHPALMGCKIPETVTEKKQLGVQL